MSAVFVRPSEPLEAIHASDPDFKKTLESWFSELGESLEDFLQIVDAQEHKPWVVRSKDGANLGLVAPANFLSKFEEVTDTDVLNDIYRERMRHADLGYTWAHDDVHGTGHLILEAEGHLTLAGATNSFTDAARRKELVQAASLIVAAIDKIDRSQTVRTFSVD